MAVIKRNKRKLVFRTYTGIIIDNPARPTPLDIRIQDIAHALSRICRFSGNVPGFFSVAAHSLIVSEWIEDNGGTPLEALCGLLHDGSEAYCADVPSPIKYHCPDYVKIERRYQRAISKRFDLPFPWPKIVDIADQAVLVNELAYQRGEIGSLNYGDRIALRKAFLDRYNSLLFATRQKRRR